MITATMATVVVYVWRLNIVVVMAPGPTKSGIAMGTAPRDSGDSEGSSSLLPEISILIEIIKSKMPPAISKLSIVMPKMDNISFPKKAKTSNKINPTKHATLYTFLLWASAIFSVNPIKMGMLPNGSTMIKSAMAALAKSLKKSNKTPNYKEH